MKNTHKSRFKQFAQASGIGHMRSRLCLSLMLIGPLCMGATNAFSQAQSSVQITPQISYTQALADDAGGRHEQARKLFDALSSTELKTDTAVPSAVNLVLLERYADARKAFDGIASSATPRDAAYAQVWQLWLSARTWQGKPNELRKHLKQQARGVQGKDAVHQALIDLYAGKGSTEKVFAAIESMPVTDVARRDLRAESAFFAGGFAQYVAADKAAALQLYQREYPNSSVSIERPLIERAIKTAARRDQRL
jgi:hypothetical protein